MKLLVYILVFGVFILSIGCEEDTEIEEPEVEIDIRNVNAKFLLIKNAGYEATRINFDFRMYFPRQNFTKFINDLKHYAEGQHIEDTLSISFDQKIYEGCKYQYLISVSKQDNDSMINEQFLSPEYITEEFPDTLYVVNWPEDSTLFEHIN